SATSALHNEFPGRAGCRDSPPCAGCAECDEFPGRAGCRDSPPCAGCADCIVLLCPVARPRRPAPSPGPVARPRRPAPSPGPVARGCRPWLSPVAVARGCRPWLSPVAVELLPVKFSEFHLTSQICIVCLQCYGKQTTKQGETKMMKETILRDALHNLAEGTGAGSEYCKGLVVGVVAALMAESGRPYSAIIRVVPVAFCDDLIG